MSKVFKKGLTFRKAIESAGKIIGNKDKINDVLKSAQKKIGNLDGVKSGMHSFMEKVSIFLRMVRAYISGTYREIPVRSIILIIAGLIYFITPVDFLPDFIPGIGLIDDVSIIISIFNSMVDDVREFRKFEMNSIEIKDDQEDETEL